MAAITELLPAAPSDAHGPVSGKVFKIERGPTGERVAYIRMFSGTIRRRQQVDVGRDKKRRITALQLFERGGAVDQGEAAAGDIAKLWGLTDTQVGDAIGHVHPEDSAGEFPPPTLEAVVTPRDPDDRARLRVALTQLAEQDPLINVRQNNAFGELTVSLYGEVQKEVIGATLATDYGIDVTFHGTTTIYIERPSGAGSSLELLQSDANPFSATVGLRVEPAQAGSGVDFRVDVDPRTIPTHIYKTAHSFVDHMNQYIAQTLEEGLFGWQVTDCTVTMTDVGYYASDGPTKPSGRTTRTQLPTSASSRRSY